MKKIALVVSLALLPACGLFSGTKKGIIEVGERSQLAGCRLLETYTWPAGDFVFGAPYMGNSKNEAVSRAEKAGATHFLYRTELKGEGIEASGVVYAFLCPPGYVITEGLDQEQD